MHCTIVQILSSLCSIRMVSHQFQVSNLNVRWFSCKIKSSEFRIKSMQMYAFKKANYRLTDRSIYTIPLGRLTQNFPINQKLPVRNMMYHVAYLINFSTLLMFMEWPNKFLAPCQCVCSCSVWYSWTNSIKYLHAELTENTTQSRYFITSDLRQRVVFNLQIWCDSWSPRTDAPSTTWSLDTLWIPIPANQICKYKAHRIKCLTLRRAGR